jgi:hypothetical protein
MKADRIPRTYDQQPFRLDGQMNLEVSFGDKHLTMPMYIKMDAYDQLLLSEGVCRQLGIISYHPDVERWRGGRRQSTQKTTAPSTPRQQEPPEDAHSMEARVPTIRVNLMQ